MSRYNAAIDANRDFAVVWRSLGIALASLGRSREACRRCAATWFALGKLLIDAGLPERALATFECAERLAACSGLSFTIPAVPPSSGDRPCACPPTES